MKSIVFTFLKDNTRLNWVRPLESSLYNFKLKNQIFLITVTASIFFFKSVDTLNTTSQYCLQRNVGKIFNLTLIMSKQSEIQIVELSTQVTLTLQNVYVTKDQKQVKELF